MTGLYQVLATDPTDLHHAMLDRCHLHYCTMQPLASLISLHPQKCQETNHRSLSHVQHINTKCKEWCSKVSLRHRHQLKQKQCLEVGVEYTKVTELMQTSIVEVVPLSFITRVFSSER